MLLLCSVWSLQCSVSIQCNYMEKSGQQNLLFHGKKKVILVWNNMKWSKWWQHSLIFRQSSAIHLTAHLKGQLDRILKKIAAHMSLWHVISAAANVSETKEFTRVLWCAWTHMACNAVLSKVLALSQLLHKACMVFLHMIQKRYREHSVAFRSWSMWNRTHPGAFTTMKSVCVYNRIGTLGTSLEATREQEWLCPSGSTPRLRAHEKRLRELGLKRHAVLNSRQTVKTR